MTVDIFNIIGAILWLGAILVVGMVFLVWYIKHKLSYKKKKLFKHDSTRISTKK